MFSRLSQGTTFKLRRCPAVFSGSTADIAEHQSGSGFAEEATNISNRSIRSQTHEMIPGIFHQKKGESDTNLSNPPYMSVVLRLVSCQQTESKYPTGNLSGLAYWWT